MTEFKTNNRKKREEFAVELERTDLRIAMLSSLDVTEDNKKKLSDLKASARSLEIVFANWEKKELQFLQSPSSPNNCMAYQSSSQQASTSREVNFVINSISQHKF